MVETIIARPQLGIPKAKIQTIGSTVTGAVYVIKHVLGSTSTLTLISGSSSNLSLQGDNIAVTTALGMGVSQKAIVREALGDIAVEYSVTIRTDGSASVFGSGTWNDAAVWNDADVWRDTV